MESDYLYPKGTILIDRRDKEILVVLGEGYKDVFVKNQLCFSLHYETIDYRLIESVSERTLIPIKEYLERGYEKKK